MVVQVVQVQTPNSRAFSIVSSIDPSGTFLSITYLEHPSFLMSKVSIRGMEVIHNHRISSRFLLRWQHKAEAHPWARDPWRCAGFLTVHDREGTFGSDPLTIDLEASPELPGNIQERWPLMAGRSEFDSI